MRHEVVEGEDQVWAPPDLQGNTASDQWRNHDASPLRQAAVGHDDSGQYIPVRCHSPSPRSLSPGNESMDNHKGNLTPPESDSFGQNVYLRELSLDEKSPAKFLSMRSPRSCKARSSGSGILSATSVSRRSVGTDSLRALGQRSPGRELHVQPAGIRKPQSTSHAHLPRGHQLRAPLGSDVPARPISAAGDLETKCGAPPAHETIRKLSKVDSGYQSLPSRKNTAAQRDDVIMVADPIPPPKRQTTIIQVSGRCTFPGLILQPDSSPISQEQLQAEVKGIYHGLLMVEAKCINIDSAQAADPNTKLGPEQWQALIALHRTLLYEHHDFLMATQHPSSTPMLRGLAMKYNMPARMWKHGIHAFLEVLRRRVPARPISAAGDLETKCGAPPAHETIRKLSKVDSGYQSLPSRKNTAAQRDDVIMVADPIPPPKRQTTIIQVSGRCTFPGLILQPDSSPISQEQLQAEVKGIYHGLLMVEAKCINIDSAQAADPNTKLGPEQWQALIALHRTLLYEHHDFLMATQHPSSTPMLRGLAMKYNMPARMWKHGIHAFLEVLRRRRPSSQDYMVSFIYMAYQMIALLYETVPIFLDTWIECLGDLARYRMAIEPNKDAHAQWGAVAARWYTMAADRYPQIGRLNHHLGILERPSLRKFCYYAKSLNCILLFLNARDSLTTLCTPIVQDEQIVQNSRSSAEACVVTFKALVYADKPYDKIQDLAHSAVLLLVQLPSPKFVEVGVSLAVSNVAELFDLGNVSSPLWQIYESVYKPSAAHSRALKPNTLAAPATSISSLEAEGRRFELRRDFCYNCANSLIRGDDDLRRLQDLLPFVHIMCIWLHSLFTVQSRLDDTDTHSVHTISSLLDGDIFSWGGLADFFTSLLRHDQMQPHIIEAAKAGDFPSLDENPEAFNRRLSEDHVARGLQWTQAYFPDNHFDGIADDDSRHLDINGDMTRARTQRVLWLGMYFVYHTDFLQYDDEQQVFTAPVAGPFPLVAAQSGSVPQHALSESPLAAAPTSPASSTSERSVEDGYTIVRRTSKPQAPAKKLSRSSQKPSSGRKSSSSATKQARVDVHDVRIVGEMAADMEWEAT
nr:est/smg-like protein 1 [Quercus suber]